MKEQYWGIDDDLLPLLPPYRPGKYDYFCPGPCSGTCKHKRLSVSQAYAVCREKYAATGDGTAYSQMLAYMEYMLEYNPGLQVLGAV